MWLFPYNGMGGLIGKAAPTVGSSPVFAYGGYSQNTGWSQAGDPGRIYFRPNNYSPLLASRALLSRSNWNHVVLTYSRTGVSLFLNGRLDSSLSGDFAIAATEAPAHYNALGAYLWDNDGSRGEPNLYANGSFDDVRIYNRALSEAEVAALYAYESDLPIASGWGSNGLEVSDVREDVAISGDGSTVLMVGGQGNMFVSMDFGTSWNDTGRQAYGRKVGLSHDGKTMLVPSHWGQLHVSHDGGLNWFTRGQGGPWQCAAVSADGSTMVAGNYYGGQMWVSRDRGESWSARGTAGDWMDVAVSINGQFMVSGRSSGPIQQSRDFGETWISGGPSGSCSAVAMTPDGRIQFAGIRGGKLYRSTDYGTNWTDLALVGDWTDAACSADGATVIFSSGTSANSGFLATSLDAGSTWITEEQGQYWETASISADGRKAVAAVYSGWIYTNTFLPSHDVVEPRPPEFTAQPVGVTTNLGGAVSLSVTAIQNVEGSMSYQWLKDGIVLPGATNPALTITNVQPPSIGDYQVVVANAVGSVTSSVAQLTIAGIKPEVWRGMVAYYPFDGSVRDESVYNGSGQMAKGEYSTNRFGKLTSSLLLRTNNDVVLNINAGVLPVGSADRTFSMWIQPNPSKLYSQEYFLALIYGNDSVPGGALTMFIQNDVFNLNPFPLAGDPRLLAQRPSRIWHGEWRHLVWVMHGTERKAECYLDGVQVPDGSFGFPGQHVINTLHTQVRVGSWHPDAPSTQQFYGGLDDIRIYRRALSRDEVISLYHSELSPVPSFGRQPQSVTVNQGESTLLSATATNAMSYQWLKDGIALTGATNPVLTITNVQPPRIGDYQVVVGNAWGAVTSSVATLNIQGVDAGIWRGLVGYYPFNSSLADLAGGNDMLRIRITETTPSPASDLQYATTSADFVPGPHPGRLALDFRNRFGEFVRATNPDSGFKDYPRWTQSFWARSMGTNGWRDTMLLMGAHGLVTFKGGQYAGVGVLLAANRITLWGHADNYMPSLAEHALDATQWHHFTIRNMDGVVRLSVDGQWVAEADLRGEGRVFAPSIGDPYFHDEFWIREGGGLGGFLTLDNNPNGWDYRGFVGSMSDLRIYNRALSEAEVAALYASEVPRPPQITAQPVGVTTNLGGTVSLSVTAIQNVEGTMSYQWLKDGIALPGATNPVLTITNVQPPRIGDYQVVVGNALGSVTSSVARLNIQGIDAGIWRGLVGYYGFDRTTQDGSPFLRHGVAHAVTFGADRFGASSSAGVFNGSDSRVVVLDDGVFKRIPFSATTWVRVGGNQGSDNAILSKYYAASANGWGLFANQNRVKSWFYGEDGHVYRPNEGETFARLDSGWHHIAIRYDDTGGTFFVDGVLVADVPWTGQPSATSSTQDLFIGQTQYKDSSFHQNFLGLIDDVRIYNRALSDAEVAALYAIEVPPAVGMVVQPQDVTAVVGSYVSLTMVATNALGYQWFKDGSPVTGAIGWATQPSLVLPKITLADAGGYWVVASNMMGSVTSRVATLVVQAPPVVTSPPEDATASLAGTASFASAVTGVPTPTLQWIRDGLPIPGATHSTLTLSNVQPAWIGDYQLVASNAAGVAVSRVARLGIPGVDSGLWRGLVAYLPFSGTVSDEGSLGHRVVAHGGSLAPDRRGKANAAMNLGGVDEFIELPDHPAFAATNYSVALWFRPTRRASGSDGAVAAESLVSKGALNWDLQLGTASEVSGGIRFRPSAGGVWEAAASSYETNRWQHLVVVHDGSGKAVALYVDGVALPLSASGTPGPVLATTQGLRFGLRFDGTQPFLGRIDDIRVYNRALSASEVKAMTSLEAAAPSVWAQPRDIRAVEGSRAVASVEVLGERPLGWEWTQAGLGVVGTRESLEFGALSRLDSGIYKVVVTNVFGAITSQPFAVDVLYRPEFVIEPTDKSVEAGVTVRLAAGVDGNPVPALQWWKDGKGLDGATNAALTLAAVQPGNAGRYQLVASNEVGTVTGREVTVRVAYAPVIGRQPTSVTVDHGRGFELFVEATGEPMPTFQWMFSGQALAGATNAVYRVESATVADEGTYKVEVRNRLGVALSEPASVTVTRRLPVVLGLPDSTEVLEGGDMVLSASVQAIPGATLQWFHEGEVLPGETHASLAVLRMRGMEGGRYSLVATNVAGVTTNSVAVRVKASEWSLGEALDTGTTLAWPWPTALGWRRQVAESYDGEDAAQSGRIGGNQSSDLRLPLEGPGRLTFWWKTSCEDGWDYAELLLDGQRKGRLTGIRNWTAVGLDVPEGLHTVTWRYIKDGSKDAGADAAWVDEVSWTPEPGVKSMPWVEAVESGDGTLQVRVVGQPGGMSVEASRDLQGWTEVGRGVSKSGVLRWRIGKEEGARFYRGKVGGGN